MTTMALAPHLQSHGGPSTSISSPKVARNRRITLALSIYKLCPRNSFRSLHFTVLERKQSCCLIQAQQSSIADSEYQTSARRNIEGNVIGKEDETSNNEEVEDTEQEKAYVTRVCDKLIEFLTIDKPNTSDWRKLTAYSEWNNIRPHFFERCRERADAENDLERKQNLLRLSRKLKEVDDDMQRHDELLNKIRENPLEIDAIVAKRRKDFTGDFFEHLTTVCDTHYSDLEARDELARIGAQCLTEVEAYDNAVGDSEALRLAQVRFDDVLNSPSLEAAAKKIDNLAKQNQLDSSMMLLITNAWASAKESTMMKDEVKDVMYHLYMTARGSLQQLLPKEIRIMKHLLALEDPQERFTALTQAFAPGDKNQVKDVDILYTTPKELHKLIVTVLDAYYNKQETLIQEARKLMKPMVIQRLEVLKGVVEAEFM